MVAVFLVEVARLWTGLEWTGVRSWYGRCDEKLNSEDRSLCENYIAGKEQGKESEGKAGQDSTGQAGGAFWNMVLFGFEMVRIKDEWRILVQLG